MKPSELGHIPALEIDHVGHRYGARVALNDVSLTVRQSSFTVLLGLNGAGKSTLFSLITRLLCDPVGPNPYSWPRCRGASPAAALSKLGVVFQSRALDVDISVRQNLMYHAALHGIASKRADELIAQVLDRVAMADRSRDRVGNLSIGQMRRIEIARALLHQPRLLLLDEPTVGLDIKARADILDHVRGCRQRKASACSGQRILSTRQARATMSWSFTRAACLRSARLTRLSADPGRRSARRVQPADRERRPGRTGNRQMTVAIETTRQAWLLAGAVSHLPQGNRLA